MHLRRGRALAAIGVGIVDALLFVGLMYFGQWLADSVNPAVPNWLGPAWIVFSFPARFLYLLPPLNHPFGFGDHEDLTLYVVAAVNGVIWAAVFWSVAARLAKRRQLRNEKGEAQAAST
jgi:hypothetical protein